LDFFFPLSYPFWVFPPLYYPFWVCCSSSEVEATEEEKKKVYYFPGGMGKLVGLLLINLLTVALM